MTLVYESERSELLDQADVFAMMKIMHVEKFEIKDRRFQRIARAGYFITCLEQLMQKHPFFVCEFPAEESETLCLIMLVLDDKDLYTRTKSKIKGAFDNAETICGDVSVEEHDDYLEVTAFSDMYYHDILRNLIDTLKEVPTDESSHNT